MGDTTRNLGDAESGDAPPRSGHADRSTTGQNTIETGAYEELDLQMAAVQASGECGTFGDDLATGVITMVAGQTTIDAGEVCLRNVGERSGSAGWVCST